MKARSCRFIVAFSLIVVITGLLMGCGVKKAGLEVVRLDSGPISGVSNDGIWAYLGVPFASSPVGELRWKAPQPVKSWREVRECTEYGPVCPQLEGSVEEGGVGDARTSEDCLYLNVWTPAKNDSEKMPVMVWIHGGAYIRGAGSVSMYDGHNLAKEGVVLVTINYRLDSLGFLAHPLLSKESPKGVSGNYGLLDQIEALKWVKSNIESFGGDKECVTIFGESAGATSVCNLMASPVAEGLFQRAIVESGPFMDHEMLFTPFRTMKQCEQIGEKFVASLGCDGKPDPMEAMREKTPEELLQATALEPGAFEGCCNIEFAPAVDGWVLPDDPVSVFMNDEQHDIPLIVGSNRDEGTLFIQDTEMSADEYRQTVLCFYGDSGEDVLKLFPPDEAGDIKQTLNRLTTVMDFFSVARFTAASMEGKKSNAFLYEFSRVPPPVEGTGVGAYHGAEMRYVFGNLDTAKGYREEDLELSRTIMRYWVNFADSGDPNGDGDKDWPAYKSEVNEMIEIGDETSVKPVNHREACDLADRIREVN